jgi:hypothetical protein
MLVAAELSRLGFEVMLGNVGSHNTKAFDMTAVCPNTGRATSISGLDAAIFTDDQHVGCEFEERLHPLSQDHVILNQYEAYRGLRFRPVEIAGCGTIDLRHGCPVSMY